MTWNHRIMRREYTVNGKKYVSYGIVEAHYDKKTDKIPNSWTEGFCGPVGETLEDFISDCAWMLAAMRWPVIDETGKECEPAAMLADDIQKWIDAQREPHD